MISLLIALLIQLGIITSDADYNNLDADQQEQYMETYQDQIIIEDLEAM